MGRDHTIFAVKDGVVRFRETHGGRLTFPSKCESGGQVTRHPQRGRGSSYEIPRSREIYLKAVMAGAAVRQFSPREICRVRRAGWRQRGKGGDVIFESRHNLNTLTITVISSIAKPAMAWRRGARPSGADGASWC